MSERAPGPRSFNPKWFAVGIGGGTAMGVAMHSLPVGVSLGVAVGVALAMTIPARRR